MKIDNVEEAFYTEKGPELRVVRGKDVFSYSQDKFTNSKIELFLLRSFYHYTEELTSESFEQLYKHSVPGVIFFRLKDDKS